MKPAGEKMHVISLLVENHQGVLVRIAGLFSGRGYNLESLTVGPTADPEISRITLSCRGEEQVVTQIKKQLNRLIDVITVIDLSSIPSVHRELALIRVEALPEKRGELFRLADVFGARIMDVGSDSAMMELTGSTEKIDDFTTLLSDYRITGMARSGIVSLERGSKTKKAPLDASSANGTGTADSPQVEVEAMQESV